MFAPKQGPRNFAAALRDLDHPKADIRASAVRDLRHHAEDRRADTVAALARLLGDPHALVRAAAAETLTDVRGKEALDALIATVDADDHMEVRQMALMAIGAIGDPRACAAIERALDDDAAPVRFQALIAYARCADRSRAAAALVEATHDDDPLVCHIDLRMAEDLADDDDDAPADPAIVARCRELLGHDDPVVRVAAAIIRARAGERDGRPVLLAVIDGTLETSQAEDEAAAIELAGELGLKEAIKPLLRRAFGGPLRIGGDRFSWQARVALASIGNGRAVQWIHSELGAWTRERRTLAVAAAGRARLVEARPALEAMRGDPSRADPDAVEEALAALARRA